MTDDRLVNPGAAGDDVQYEAGLRPRTLDDYIGQPNVRENLHVSIAAAKQRGEALDTSCFTVRRAWERRRSRT